MIKQKDGFSLMTRIIFGCLKESGSRQCLTVYGMNNESRRDYRKREDGEKIIEHA